MLNFARCRCRDAIGHGPGDASPYIVQEALGCRLAPDHSEAAAYVPQVVGERRARHALAYLVRTSWLSASIPNWAEAFLDGRG